MKVIQCVYVHKENNVMFVSEIQNTLPRIFHFDKNLFVNPPTFKFRHLLTVHDLVNILRTLQNIKVQISSSILQDFMQMYGKTEINCTNETTFWTTQSEWLYLVMDGPCQAS